MQDLHDSINHLLRTNGYEERSFEETRRAVGNGIRQLVALSVPDGENNPDFERLFGEFREYYSAHCQIKTRPYDGISETLDVLRAMGIKMAVVSNKIDPAVKELASQFYPQLHYALGEIAGVPRKPAPDMVLAALDAIGADKSETVFIGDSEVDILTAKNAGLPCISVLWGFRKKEELLLCGADVFVDRPSEIIKLVQG